MQNKRLSLSKNKKGISAIVATVMLILITVAAVAILWGAIIPMIKTSLDFSALTGQVTVLDNGYTMYDSSRDLMSVQVKRDQDEGVMNRVNLILTVQGNSYSTTVIAPESGGAKVYTFNMTGIGIPESISVVPIFAVGKQEKVGSASSSIDVRKAVITEVNPIILTIGNDYNFEMPMNGLVAWWKFNEDLADIKGEHIFTLGGGASRIPTDGRHSLSFDASVGARAYTLCEDVSPGLNSFTYSMWAYPRSFEGAGSEVSPDNRARFFQHYHGEILNDDLRKSIVGEFRTTGDILFFGKGYGDTEGFEVSADTSIDRDSWHHIAFVGDVSSKRGIIYVDGIIAVNESISELNGPLNMTDDCVLSGADYELNGAMDDLTIYHRALSSEEIFAIYNVQL